MATPESAAVRASTTKRPPRPQSSSDPIRAQLDTVERASGDAVRYVREQLDSRPYTTLGVGLAAGYVLGGGLTVRLAGTLLALTGRFAMASLVSSAVRGLQPSNGRNES
ncbi:MAG TPA: hypothetical protein VGR62_11370 [Candidatus Binatia bacterium]|jgi:hypothetical protein|nr:hypothetical protein [Candidatus Binatia bacterium]